MKTETQKYKDAERKRKAYAAKKVATAVKEPAKKLTLVEVVEKAQALIDRHIKGADADAGFDAGEFSGPAHDRMQADEIATLAEANGFTADQIEDELMRLASAPEYPPPPVDEPTSASDADRVERMVSLAKTVAKKPASKTAPEPPQGPLVTVLEDGGFTLQATERIGALIARGYTHQDGRAALYTTEQDGGNPVVVLRRTDQTTTECFEPVSLTAALKVKPLGKRKAKVALARERGQKAASRITAGKVAAVPAKLIGAAAALDAVKSAAKLAADEKVRQITVAAGVPMHVVRAVEMLEGLQPQFNIDNLRGDSNYGHRMALMTVLLGYERGSAKVKAAETGVNHLVATFQSALGVKGSSKAKCNEDFADRCRLLLERVAIARKDAKRTERKAIRTVKHSAVAAALTVPGKVLIVSRPLNRKKRQAADIADRAAIYAEAAAVEQVAQPRPSTKWLQAPILVKALRLLRWLNGDMGLKLEHYNSQGAMYIADTGRAVISGVLTPTLARDVTVQAYDLEAIAAYVCLLLASKSERSADIVGTLTAVGDAISRHDAPIALAPMTSLIARAPREGAAEPRIVANHVRLLEDSVLGPVLLQLEKENSQGAICVYNNNSRVTVGVVLPEILKTLRASADTNVVEVARQLLNPATPSVPATPTAVRHLTAVLHCKENSVMETNKLTSTSAAKKSTTAPAKKSTAAPAKKSTTAPAKKSTAAPAKKSTAAQAAPRGSYAGKKIKVLNKEHGAREGTKRAKAMDLILGAKTTDEVMPKLVKIGANNTFIAFAVSQGFVELV